MATPEIPMTEEEIEKWIEIIGKDWEEDPFLIDGPTVWSTKSDFKYHYSQQKAIEEWIRIQFK